MDDVPTIPVANLYKHMIDNNRPILPFQLADESVDDTASIWTLGHYFLTQGSIFWCWPAMLACWPFQLDSTWHTIVDDDVEAAPIYRNDGKAGQPVMRPHKNHDLPIKQESTQMESQQKQQAQLKTFPKSGSLDISTQNPGNAMRTHGLL